VEFIEFSEPLEDVIDKVNDADLIYLTGGQVSTLISRLSLKGIDGILRSFDSVIVGRSAGAMVLGKECLVTGRYRRQSKVVTGLGLVDFSIKAHYDFSKDELLSQSSRNQKIYAIKEASALVFKDNQLSVFGEVFLFENGVKTAFA
jgi:dipeptidase E